MYGQILNNALARYGQIQQLKDLGSSRRREQEAHEARMGQSRAQTDYTTQLRESVEAQMGAQVDAGKLLRAEAEIAGVFKELTAPGMDEGQYQQWVAADEGRQALFGDKTLEDSVAFLDHRLQSIDQIRATKFPSETPDDPSSFDYFFKTQFQNNPAHLSEALTAFEDANQGTPASPPPVGVAGGVFLRDGEGGGEFRAAPWPRFKPDTVKPPDVPQALYDEAFDLIGSLGDAPTEQQAIQAFMTQVPKWRREHGDFKLEVLMQKVAARAGRPDLFSVLFGGDGGGVLPPSSAAPSAEETGTDGVTDEEIAAAAHAHGISVEEARRILGP